MSRPLICEPALPNRWRNGDIRSALCTICNSCFKTIERGSLYFVAKKEEKT